MRWDENKLNAEGAEDAEESRQSGNCVSSAPSAASALQLPASLRLTSVTSVASVVKSAITNRRASLIALTRKVGRWSHHLTERKVRRRNQVRRRH